MRGDRVEVVVDTGNGTRSFDIVARRNGRRVETTTGRGIVEVTEVTRGGRPVRTARFMASRVVAVVEHPVYAGPVDTDELDTVIVRPGVSTDGETTRAPEDEQADDPPR
jgi:hypothetical protein